MSEKNHLDTAEDSLRQAIISCLNNKKDENIKDLFKALQLIRSVNSKTPDIDLGNIDFDYSSYLDSSPITFESDYIAGADQIELGQQFRVLFNLGIASVYYRYGIWSEENTHQVGLTIKIPTILNYEPRLASP